MKIFNKMYLSLLLILFSSSIIAQRFSIDSLKKALQNEKEDTDKVKTMSTLGWNLSMEKDFKDAIQSAQNSLALAEKINYAEGKAYAFWSIGVIYSNSQIIDSALKNFFIALKLYQQLNNKLGIATTNKFIADIYQNEENFSEAIVYYYGALKTYEESENKYGIASCFNGIGFNNFYLHNYDESLKNFQLCLKISQEINYNQGINDSYIYISKIYTLKQKYDAALKIDSAVLKVSDSSSDQHSIGNAYFEIGYNFQKQSEAYKTSGKEAASKEFLTEAEKDLLKAVGCFKETDSGALGDTYSQLGTVYTSLHKFSEAQKYFEMAIQTGKDIKFNDNLKTAYEGLTRLDSVDGNYQQAYKDLKLFIEYRDKIINEQTTKKTLQATMQYDFDKKEAVAKAMQDKKDADAKRIKSQQYFAIAGLGVVVFAVLIIALIQFRNNNHKQKANLLLQQQKVQVESTLSELKSTQAQLIQSEKMASLGELTAGIAHEIQNPLNFVNNFSEVNKELIDELKTELATGNTQQAIELANDIKDNEQKINHHGKRADAIVKGMLQHSRSSVGAKEPTDINALADEYLRLSYHGLRAKDNSFNSDIKTDFDSSIGKINIIPQDIGRVLLNLYNNAFYAVNEKQKNLSGLKDLIGFTYEPIVSITTKKEQNRISISVSDNGNGIPQNIVDKIFQPFFTTKPTGQGTGLGLSLSYDIVKAHGGEIKVEMKVDKGNPDNFGKGEGTTFTIQLPITAS